MKRKTSKSELRSLTDRVLLVRLEQAAALLRDALDGSGSIAEARHLAQAGQTIRSLEPTVLLVNESFPALEQAVLREMVSQKTPVHPVAADADLETLLALVYGGRPQRQPPRL